MGNQSNSPQLTKILEKYRYVCEQVQSTGHKGSLYRKKTENYDYVIFTQTLIPHSIAQDLQAELKCITACKNVLPILKIYHLDIQDSQSSTQASQSRVWRDMCSTDEKEYKSLVMCLQYANYSLRDHVAFKKKSSQFFSLKEYVYVMKTAVQIAMVLSDYDFKYLQFELNADYLFITSKGELKLYPIRSKSFEVFKEQCECFTQYEPCSSFGKRSKEQPVVIGLRKGSKSKKQKYMKQIKQLSCLVMDIGQRSSKRYEQFQSHEQAKRISNLHASLIKICQLQELNAMISPLEDDIFVFGPTDQPQQTNRKAQLKLESMNCSNERIPTQYSHCQKNIPEYDYKENRRNQSNRAKLQLNVHQARKNQQPLQTEPTIASPCHALQKNILKIGLPTQWAQNQHKNI